jgi:PIN domain nuclease of toxin-antitoxin system
MDGRGVISHVLDTCALLDLAADRWTKKDTRAALASAVRPVVLSISVWELARKLRLGKLELPCDQHGVWQFVKAICERHQIALEPLTGEICEAAELLPAYHEDPFDRMIIGLARRAHCPVFTTDQKYTAYPVQVISHR